MNKKTALFFGSFNPIHNGHLILANYFTEYTDINELWFVLSPQNPFKKKQKLLDFTHRLQMLKKAIDGYNKFNICTIEKDLPKPSYTINTLNHLKKKYPKKNFVILMGADNILNITQWKDYQTIIENYQIYVYPRKGFNPKLQHKSIKYINAPLVEISSTFIRKSIENGKNVRFFLPYGIFDIIKDNGFYQRSDNNF